MTHFLDNFSMSVLFSNMTDFFYTISPLVAFLVGLLLAFLVIDSIIFFLQEKKNHK